MTPQGLQGITGTQRGNELIATFENPRDPEVRDIYFGMQHFTSYRNDDKQAIKILSAFLGNTDVHKLTIADALEINRCLVTRYSQQMLEGGISSLLEDDRGRPGKITDAISEYVKRQYRRYRKKSKKNFREKIRNEVKERFDVKISRELIRQITQDIRNKEKADHKVRREDERGEESKALEVVNYPVENNKKNIMRLMLKLQSGFYSRYAGGMILNVFIEKLIVGVFEGYEDSELLYDLKAFMIMVIQMVVYDVINLERVKRVIRGEFGILIGVETAPSLRTMRRKINEAVEKLDIEKISTRLAINYLDNLNYGTDIFYIDDHLEVYWGKVKVLQGFSNIFDRMMEGIEHTFVHNRWGDPICFELRDNYNNFREYIPMMVKRVQKMYKLKKRLTFVFDRFGYDQKLFEKFNKELKANYIVWVKGDKTDYSKESIEFDEVIYKFKWNVPGKERKVKIGIAVVEVKKKGIRKKRKIVLRRKAERRIKGIKKYMYSSLITNDLTKPKEEIVEHLIYRWREECDFKIEVNEFGIDEITSYMMKPYDENIFNEESELSSSMREEKEMENPRLKPLRYRKGQLKKEILKIDGQLGKWVFTKTKKKERTIEEVSQLKRNSKLLSRREELAAQLEEIVKKMSLMPKQVNRLENLIERNFKIFDFRKKLVMDTLKVCARNVRKMALEVFDKYYKNYRDQLDFLRRIFRNGGYISINSKGEVTVDIAPFNTESENEITINFLNEINAMNPCLFGANALPVTFRVAGI